MSSSKRLDEDVNHNKRSSSNKGGEGIGWMFAVVPKIFHNFLRLFDFLVSLYHRHPPPLRSPSCIAVAHAGTSDLVLFFAAMTASISAFFASLSARSDAMAVARLVLMSVA